MMGNYDFNSMMSTTNGAWGVGLWGAILYLITVIDLILLGIWLWKKITNK